MASLPIQSDRQRALAEARRHTLCLNVDEGVVEGEDYAVLSEVEGQRARRMLTSESTADFQRVADATHSSLT